LVAVAAGDQVRRLVAVTGEDGLALDECAVMQQALLIVCCFLQQNALDPVDAAPDADREAVRAHHARLSSMHTKPTSAPITG
jgi:vacuolar-type H+-ATPase catalytic subunit A/Vma1